MTRSITQIRQGDVLLERVDPPITSTRVADARGLRVEGERTGHAHVLPAEVHNSPQGRLLRLKSPTPITHEEHAPIEVPAGWWRPVLQREWTEHAPVRRARFD
jgi:hypothetical protein